MNWNEHFIYDGSKLIWARKPSKNLPKGRVAGSKKVNGYISVGLKGAEIFAHRIIFEMHYGEIPKGFEIDHINGVRDDNRLCNLRLVTHAENNRNKKPQLNNSTGVTGVRMDTNKKKWHAAIQVDGIKYHIGYFDDFNAACEARRNAEISIGYHPKNRVTQ